MALLWKYDDLLVATEKKLRDCNAVLTYDSKTDPTELRHTVLEIAYTSLAAGKSADKNWMYKVHDHYYPVRQVVY